MKDYTATITITMGFQAGSDEKAEERAQTLADNLTFDPAFKLPKWCDDGSFSVADVTVEEN